MLPRLLHFFGAVATGFLIPSAPLLGQATPLGTVESFRVESQVLGEEREIVVSLPPNYHDGSAFYPLLMVLDGESLVAPASGIATFLADLLEMPRMIVIGIPNVARTRDLTPEPEGGFMPPFPPGEARVAGADRFLRFIIDEVLPEVDRRYRTVPFRVLVGHSLGGLFVVHALIQRPDVFGAGLTLDPSLWWNDRNLVDRLSATLAADSNATRMRVVTVELAGGFRDDWSRVAAASRAEVFGSQILIESGESHATMPVRGLREGLRALFPDYPPAAPRPGANPVTTLADQYRLVSSRLGYQVSTPVAALVEAGSQAVDGGMLEAAAGVAMRLREEGHGRLADAVERRIDASRLRGDEGLIPLIIPNDRPTRTELAPFVGTWRGRLDYEPGTDMDLVLEISSSGDSILIGSRQIGPAGGILEGGRVLVDITDSGTFEFGAPMRGGVGLEVYMATLVDGNRLVGQVEFRGFRLPAGALAPTIRFDLRRDSIF